MCHPKGEMLSCDRRALGVVLLGLLMSLGACARGDGSPDNAFRSGICAFDGRLVRTKADGSCPTLPELAQHQLDFVSFNSIDSAAYDGMLPKCKNQPPYDGGFRIDLEIEDVKTTFSLQGSGAIAAITVVAGVNRGATPACGTALTLLSFSEAPTLQVGDVVTLTQRTVPRSDTDTPLLYAIYDHRGALLYATALGIHLERFAEDFGDLLPDLTITSTGAVVCRAIEINEQLTTVNLISGDSSCGLDAHTQRCCRLWSNIYEVQMLDAFTASPTRPWTLTGFTIRAPGTFRTVALDHMTSITPSR